MPRQGTGQGGPPGQSRPSVPEPLRFPSAPQTPPNPFPAAPAHLSRREPWPLQPQRLPPARRSKMAAPLNLALSGAAPPPARGQRGRRHFPPRPLSPPLAGSARALVTCRRRPGSAPPGSARGEGCGGGRHEQEEPGLLRAAGRARLPQPLQAAGRVSGGPHGGHQGNALAQGWEGAAPASWRFPSLDARPSPPPSFSRSGRWGSSVPGFCSARGSRSYPLKTDWNRLSDLL